MTNEPNISGVANELEDLDVGDLIRILQHSDVEEIAVENGGTLLHQAVAILELCERGYVVDGALVDVAVRDMDGNALLPEDVEDYRGGA